MWFADIVCDLDWYVGRKGELGQARLHATVRSNGAPASVSMCVYGSDHIVQHLRVVMDVNSYELASECINQNVHYWNSLLEVATGFIASETCTSYVMPATSLFMVIMGEGDENAPSVELQPKFEEAQPLNYQALGACLSNWDLTSATHLFFLSRFLNNRLPWEIRWLNGYHLAEWHFQRGKDGLSKNGKWRELLSNFEAELQPHLRPGQTTHGFFEETRATVAHAILDSRPIDERTRKPGSAVQWSFPVLEKIVIRIGNNPDIRIGNVFLLSKQDLPAKNDSPGR